MQTTRYFREQVMAKRSYLQYAWIEDMLAHPARVQTEENGRIRMWGYVPAFGKYLRVVTLADGLTVHNAFPDRRYKEVEEP